MNLRGWDTHQSAFRDLKGKLLPSIDSCLSVFLDDPQQRGLFDETLVVVCGEMGCTPGATTGATCSHVSSQAVGLAPAKSSAKRTKTEACQ